LGRRISGELSEDVLATGKIRMIQGRKASAKEGPSNRQEKLYWESCKALKGLWEVD